MKLMSSKVLKHLARREFPQLYALASTWVATPLLGICTIVYIREASTHPAASTFPLALSAFSVTAALCAISFSMARVCDNPTTPKYAGEKFLHSAMLLIQGLFVIYIRDSAGEIDLLKPWPYIVLAVKAFCVGLLSLLTIVAAWTWYYGFSELNKFLWKNWEDNIRAINAQRDNSTVGLLPETVGLTATPDTTPKV